MIVTITTFNLAQPTTLDEITKTFQITAPKYRGVAGLLSKNYWMSEDGRRVGGIYVWETRPTPTGFTPPSGRNSSKANTARRPRSNICTRR
jgi:hypothetical protein